MWSSEIAVGGGAIYCSNSWELGGGGPDSRGQSLECLFDSLGQPGVLWWVMEAFSDSGVVGLCR